jgi:hypothetical protein
MKIVTYPITDDTSKTEYSTLRNLKYSPSADIISNRVSVDEVECDIQTDYAIQTGLCAELKDDNDLLWFYGRITYSEFVQDHIVHVIISSELTFLDRFELPAKMYTGQTAKAAIEECFLNTGATVLFDEDAVAGKTVTGFGKEQSNRNRLQHILFACGLYIKSSFVQHPTVTVMDSQNYTLIPKAKTFWKPTPTYKEWVTAVNVFQYSFQQGTPQQGDEYVTDGTTTWIVTHQNVRLTNPNVPSIAATNEVHVEDVMLINANNSSEILSSMALYYFKRTEIDLDVVNDGEFNVGNKYTIDMGDDSTASGYCEELDFTFGTHAKSRMKLGASEAVASQTLTITYINQDSPNIIISRETYRLPQGYAYSIQTRYQTLSYQGYEYVFRPTINAVTGTMGSGAVTATVNCRIALKLDLSSRILEIVSVDDVERTSETHSGETIYTAEIE